MRTAKKPNLLLCPKCGGELSSESPASAPFSGEVYQCQSCHKRFRLRIVEPMAGVAEKREVLPETVCQNCGKPLLANFCPECGLPRGEALPDPIKTYFTDQTTGVFNMRLLELLLDLELKRSQRYLLPVSLIMISVDDVSRVVREYGPEAADRLLKEVAEVLRGCVREVDAVARCQIGADYPEDCFCLLLSQTHEVGAYATAEKIKEVIKGRLFMVKGNPLQITLSLGIAYIPVGGSAEQDLLQQARQALSEAKKMGKDKIVVFVK